MDLGIWRDIAIVWLGLQLFVLLAIPLAVLYFMVRGIQILHTKLPPLFQKAQNYSGRVRSKTDELSDQVAAPVIASHRSARRVQGVLDSLWRQGRPEATTRKARS